MNVLVLTDWFLPGYKAGGPIRTLENIIARLSQEFTWSIVTRDRDVGDEAPYPGITAGGWQDVAGVPVCYLRPGDRGALRRVLASTPHDVLYINSFFSPQFSALPLVLRRVGAVPRRPVILAPRGEFSPGAFALKRRKKQAYVAAFRRLGLGDGIVWQASTELEAEVIRQHIGGAADVFVAPNPASPILSQPSARTPKVPGRLRVSFLSRISPKKNLATAIRLLEGLPGEVTLDIYGPTEDERYWSACQAAIAEARSVRVTYHGSAPHDSVAETLAQYDLFFFPTLGENFGHVIIEALLSGTPVLVSDQTPWSRLPDRRAGWDLPLAEPERFREVLRKCIEMDDEEHRTWSAGAHALGREYLESGEAETRTAAMIRHAIALNRRTDEPIGRIASP